MFFTEVSFKAVVGALLSDIPYVITNCYDHTSYNDKPELRGYHLKVNGYVISIQFDRMNSASRSSYWKSKLTTDSVSFEKHTIIESVETAIWHNDSKANYVEYKGNDVQGYQSPADVIATILHFAHLDR